MTIVDDVLLGYYCYDCHKDMCVLCYEEVDEETALKNGAKKYLLRAAALDTCHKHCLKPASERYQRICDSCGDFICAMGTYHNKDNYDICKVCYDKSPNSYTELTPVKNDLMFGSIRDWFVLVEDEDTNAILCNLNVDSPFYKRFAFLAVDGHGRGGYWISKDTDFQSILEEYDLTKSKAEMGPDYKYKDDPLDGEIDIDCRITRMMLLRKMKVYYG